MLLLEIRKQGCFSFMSCDVNFKTIVKNKQTENLRDSIYDMKAPEVLFIIVCCITFL